MLIGLLLMRGARLRALQARVLSPPELVLLEAAQAAWKKGLEQVRLSFSPVDVNTVDHMAFIDCRAQAKAAVAADAARTCAQCRQ